MKRNLTTILLFAGLVAVLAFFLVILQPDRGWLLLPDGAKTRVFTVTQGTTHRLTFPTRSWNAHYQKLFSRGFTTSTIRELFQREHGGTGASSHAPSTVIWFQSDSSRTVSFEASLVTADGQKYETRAANGPTTDGYAYTGLLFPVVPSDPTLHLNATINGKSFKLEIPNPAFHEAVNR